MENDGVRGDVSGDPGSGLAGLRERLDGVGGTLRTERAERTEHTEPAGRTLHTERTERDGGTFRLRAEVPLDDAVGNGSPDGEDQ
jgi:two-component system sensor histidine kinase DesK